MVPPTAIDEGLHPVTEGRDIEDRRVPANVAGIEAHTLDTSHGLRERRRGLLLEEHSGLTLDDRLESSTRCVRDDGAAASLGLERGEAIVLLLREDKRSTTGVQIKKRVVRHLAQKAYVRCGRLLEDGPLRAITDDQERPPE